MLFDLFLLANHKLAEGLTAQTLQMDNPLSDAPPALAAAFSNGRTEFGKSLQFARYAPPPRMLSQASSADHAANI